MPIGKGFTFTTIILEIGTQISSGECLNSSELFLSTYFNVFVLELFGEHSLKDQLYYVFVACVGASWAHWRI